MAASPPSLTLPEQQCEYCGAWIKWATLLPGKSKIPIDAEPRANTDPAPKLLHRVQVRESFNLIGNAHGVRYVALDDKANHPRLYAPHKTTCPNADQWAKSHRIPALDRQSHRFKQSMLARFEEETRQRYEYQMARDD